MEHLDKAGCDRVSTPPSCPLLGKTSAFGLTFHPSSTVILEHVSTAILHQPVCQLQQTAYYTTSSRTIALDRSTVHSSSSGFQCEPQSVSVTSDSFKAWVESAVRTGHQRDAQAAAKDSEPHPDAEDPQRQWISDV